MPRRMNSIRINACGVLNKNDLVAKKRSKGGRTDGKKRREREERSHKKGRKEYIFLCTHV